MDSILTLTSFLCQKNTKDCNNKGKLSNYKVGRFLFGVTLELATYTSAFIFISNPFIPAKEGNSSSSARLLRGSLCLILGWKLGLGLSRGISLKATSDPAAGFVNFWETIKKTEEEFRLVIVTDIHVSKRKRKLNGTVGTNSPDIEGRLPNLLQRIVQQHKPHLIVNLGDLIRSETLEIDEDAYTRQMPIFKQLETPVLHVPGNHEFKKMSVEKVEKIWHEAGFRQASYGYTERGAFNLVWLGLRIEKRDEIKLPYLPEEQLIWLEKYFNHHRRPTIVLTHCPIDNQDLSGDFYFEGCNRSKAGFFLENQEKVRDIISRSGSVIAVIQGHLHHFHAKQIHNVSYITCPSMGDNLCAPDNENNIPDIYSVATFDATTKKFRIKAFSRDHSFSGYEAEWKG